MKRPYKEESLRWLTQAEDEFEDADTISQPVILMDFPAVYPHGISMIPKKLRRQCNWQEALLNWLKGR